MIETEQPLSPLQKLRLLWEETTPRHVGIGIGALSVLVMILSLSSAYSDDGPLPAPRPLPPSPEQAAVTSYRYKEGFYHALVDEDCDKVKVGRLSLDELRRGQRFEVELATKHSLALGRTLETPSLRLRAVAKKLWVGDEGHEMRAQHLVLQITNRTNHYLAYRVVTKARGRCRSGGSLTHNALALKPRQTVTRTECLLRGTKGLTVRKVEVLELSPLGYYYVSRIDPTHLRFAGRTARGHNFGGQPQCKLIPWRAITAGIENGDVAWQDVADFYSRHNCDEYTFEAGYRWSPRGLDALPVKPSSEKP